MAYMFREECKLLFTLYFRGPASTRTCVVDGYAINGYVLTNVIGVQPQR